MTLTQLFSFKNKDLPRKRIPRLRELTKKSLGVRDGERPSFERDQLVDGGPRTHPRRRRCETPQGYGKNRVSPRSLYPTTPTLETVLTRVWSGPPWSLNRSGVSRWRNHSSTPVLTGVSSHHHERSLVSLRRVSFGTCALRVTDTVLRKVLSK